MIWGRSLRSAGTGLGRYAKAQLKKRTVHQPAGKYESGRKENVYRYEKVKKTDRVCGRRTEKYKKKAAGGSDIHMRIPVLRRDISARADAGTAETSSVRNPVEASNINEFFLLETESDHSKL